MATMWDFDVGKALNLMLRTMPFIGLRLAVYFGIALAYIIATGGGAGVGYMIGRILQDAETGVGFAFWGGLIGFGVVSGALYFAREYLLYLLKAGHIAALVQLLDNQTIAGGGNQIAHAMQIVKTRFIEASVLFGIDQIIKGILRAFNRAVFTLSSFLPIPGVKNVIGFVTTVINLSLTYVDEAILAYNIRTGQENPWIGARDGVVLYAQNYKLLLKNAVWLTVFVWVLTLAIFLAIIAPVAALVAWVPGIAGFWTLVIALVVAFSLKAALIDPVAMICIMQVYFKAIEGQTPRQEWVDKLNALSAQFRQIGEKAAAFVANKSGLPGAALPER